MPRCCQNCFTDGAIREQIQRSGQQGRCQYCLSDDVFTIEPNMLTDLFGLLTDCIEEVADGGCTAEFLFDKEFRLFSPNVRRKDELTQHLLDIDVAGKNFVLIHDTNKYAEAWASFKDELIHRNRFFPQHDTFDNIFSQKGSEESDMFIRLIGDLGTTRCVDEEFYRARIEEKQLSSQEMGMPNPNVASAGRANPRGIAYLYLAGTVETCMKEVRPSIGQIVNISKFIATKDLKLINLTDPKKSVALLRYEEDEIGLILQYMNWLELFSSDLSKPVLPDKSHLDYIPTQFVCEYIKAVTNMDGIIFTSSYGTGVNYVLFGSDGFNVEDPVRRRVTSIDVKYCEHID